MNLSEMDDTKTMILGIHVTILGIYVAARAPFFGYSGFVADFVILAGIWISVSGYFAADGVEDSDVA